MIGECFNDEMVTTKDKFAGTRSTLLVRLKDLEDQEAWYYFFETYWKLIFNFALKSGLDESDAEDVVQETVRAVARQMPEFEYNRQRGSFRSWLLTLTHRRVIDHFRHAERHGGRETIGVEPGEWPATPPPFPAISSNFGTTSGINGSWTWPCSR